MRNQKVNVVYMATMSAGKTTCINALLGTELLHSANEATTATITEIRSSNKELIRCYGESKKLVEEVFDIAPEKIRELNSNEKINEIFIEGNFNIDENLVIVDTPGPNNSRDNNHKNLSYNYILNSKFDFLIYVINSTQPFINDDVQYLKFIYKNVKSNKIIFLVNKLDDFDLENESIENFKINLEKYLNELGFNNPVIFGVSAYRALLIKKLIYQEKMSRKERRDLLNLIDESEDILGSELISLSPNMINNVKVENRFGFLGEDFQDLKYLNEIYCKTGFPYFEFYLKNRIHELNK
ncbi:dynamin family protein [Acinetobacter junii]|uniref:dynamin family protein n=1 Tax=Acinetobacter junii TaxID=40215 RepID=UPI003FA2F920